MITGRVVGDDAVIAWLRAVTDTAASGLARAISELCLDLQRKTLKPNDDLQIEESGDRIAATISGDGNQDGARERRAAGTGNIRAGLRRAKEASKPRGAANTINIPSYRRRIEAPEPSFLSSALRDMDPEIRDRVEEALREAVAR
jgi:hypothetical protein